MDDLESSIVDLTKRLDDFRRTHGDVAERISANGKNSVLYERRRADVSSLESKVEKAASLIATLSADLRDVVSQLEKARSTQDKSVAVRRKNLQGEIQRLSDDDRRLMSSLTSHASSLGKDERDLEDIRRRHVERDVLLEEARMLSRLTSAFSKKGVPLLVTRSQLPAINAAISSVLNGIVDFDVSLEVDDDTDTLEIVVDYGDSRRYIEMCSGMEKTMASLAVRVGLSKVTSLPKPDFFVIDEGFGTLDAGAVESCNRFLTSLKRHFKTVFVITHVDGIKDCADHVLEITRNEKDSCLVAI
jgi:exonuclease SbcC